MDEGEIIIDEAQNTGRMKIMEGLTDQARFCFSS
jgi:hypothetical protein